MANRSLIFEEVNNTWAQNCETEEEGTAHSAGLCTHRKTYILGDEFTV